MARKVLFIFLSLVVFGSAIGSGYSHFMARKAADDYRKALIQKAKVGAIVAEANRKERQEREWRKKVELKLKGVTADNQKVEKAKSQLEQKVISLQASVEELKIKRTLAEEALSAARKDSKKVSKLKSSSKDLIAKLEGKVSAERKRQKSLEAKIKRFEKKLTKLTKVKDAAVLARAESEKNIYKLKRENTKNESEFKRLRADLSNAKEQVKVLTGEKADLLKKLEGEKKVAVASASSGAADVKVQERFQNERKAAADKLAGANKALADINQKLVAANKEIQELKSIVGTSNNKVTELEKALELSKAETAKAVADTQKQAEEEKSKAVKEIAELKKAIENSKAKLAELTKRNKEPKPVVAKKQVEKKKEVQTASKDQQEKEEEERAKKEEQRAKVVQGELKRLGCYTGKIDGVWGRGSLDALVKFSKSANLNRVRKYPTTRTIEILKGRAGTVCVAGKPGDQNNKKTAEAKPANAGEPRLPTLKEQCLASCVGAFESIQSCRSSC